LSSRALKSARLHLAVGIDHGEFAVFSFDGIAVLHADDQVAPGFGELARDVAEDVGIIDLPGARFLPAGVVAGLYVADLVPACVDVGDEVSLADLLVIDIKKNLAARAVDCLADGLGLV